MSQLDPKERVERFVLRARRLMEHSLVREQSALLTDLAKGTVRMQVTVNPKTVEGEQRIQIELPPEEAFESFAARMRPFTMSKEPVYWENALDALESLLSKETLTEFVDMESLREHWKSVVTGRKIAQAYFVVTDEGEMTDFQLAELWLNSDALHTQLIQSAVGKELSLSQRYQAAAGVYSRIGAVANHTYHFISYLVHAGLLQLDPEVFTAAVMAETSIDMPAEVYSSAVGAGLPTDLSNLDPMDASSQRHRPTGTSP
ncbi:hypothetical protein GCM10009645_54070 [Mycolicibacterium poriferae]|uniref:Uncharacterized protein n=1 Tax=Mycolicibacterium poriferae TaxID=39694 RepID=A0A6N4VG70_9MYCO|nr:hypothetical protein [Mycolicibacterium poriferae]BBX53143.1 hypothetical protein MPOR_41690 [Mycolicibacterium poriferae]